MSYIVLARRYRSRDFDEIVGQEPIARTLKNAVKTGRTAHAYLFCGTRGVGKTSMARIFARAMNITDELTEKAGIADAINRGDDLDVIEIDGASNRGINEARDLIATAGLSPARCPYKIYIIDEVHMLTIPAFNVLLKTMEEPPSHVKFILCTTEPHKVPATIQSRCQCFDFKPIPSPLIAEHLRKILENEKIEADDEVVLQVARLGDGSMRDALSLLDRLLAAGEHRLTLELFEQLLGIPDHAQIRQLIGALSVGDAKQALEIGGQLLAAGVSIEQAFNMLTDTLRDLLVLTACGSETPLVDCSSEARGELVELAGTFDNSGLVHLIAICDAASRNSRGSVTARALFDAALVRMSQSEHLADIPALLGGAEPTSTRSRSGSSTTATSSEESKKKQPVNPPPSPPPEPVRESKATEVSTPRAITEVKPDESVTLRMGASDIWPLVKEEAKRAPMMQAVIDDLNFEACDESTIRLSLNEHGRQRARFLLTQREKIEHFISKVGGRRYKVTLDVSAGTAPAVSVDTTTQTEEAKNLPFVKKAMELFDAVVVEVTEEKSDET